MQEKRYVLKETLKMDSTKDVLCCSGLREDAVGTLSCKDDYSWVSSIRVFLLELSTVASFRGFYMREGTNQSMQLALWLFQED